MAEIVEKGKEVEIHYTGKLQDGRVFDSTEERGPFKFVAGSDNIIDGVNDAVLGMEVGQKKTVEVEPTNAYGDYNQELLVRLPREKVPQDAEVGDALSDKQNAVTWWVRDLGDQEAVLDGNHPLAGETLVFDIEVVSVV